MTDQTTVIYNDTCPICSREVDGYRRMAHEAGAGIAFEGLGDGGPERLGLDPDTAARRFHVMRDGQLLSGVPAFIALWQELPRLRWLARLASLPGILTVAGWGYDRVAAPVLYALHRRRQRRRR